MTGTDAFKTEPTPAVTSQQENPRGAIPGPVATEARFLRQILESAIDYAIIVLDLEGRITLWNEGAARILGWREAAIIGRSVECIFTPEDRAAHVAAAEMGAALEHGRGNDERWHLREDGSQFWASGEMMVLRSEQGVAHGFLKILRDRTSQRVEASQRLSTEEALRNSESYLRLLLASTAEGFYAVDRDGVTTLCNPAFLDMLGFASEAEAVGQKLHDVIHHTRADGGHYHAVDCPIYRCARDGTAAHVLDEDFYRLDGTVVPVEYWAHPIVQDGKLCGAICTFVDISARKQAEAFARDSTSRRLALLELSDRLRGDTDLTEMAHVAAAVLGQALSASRAGYGTFDPSSKSVVIERDWTAPGVATAAGVHSVNLYGSFLEALESGSVVAVADIERDPRTSERVENFRLVKTRAFIQVPIIEASKLVAVFFVSSHTPRDWSEEEIGFVHDVAERTRSAVARRQAEAELQVLMTSLESEVATRTATLMHTEEVLRQSQKMEAVGQLTGGLAHDFNNLLMSVGGSVEILGHHIRQGQFSNLERYVEAAQQGLGRAASLTHRLLAFSRRQTLEPKLTDINQLVAGMDDLIRRTIGPAVTLDIRSDGGLWPVLVDYPQLENALLNLCINARDAMPDGGCITVQTSRCPAVGRPAEHEDIPEGEHVLLCVMDTGCGIPPDLLSRIFDPFFTTKPLGQGTGLGLSMIYGFARQSGGGVKVVSELDRGTTMCLYLPRADAGLTELDAPPATLPQAVHSDVGQMVLVVDDEPLIRMLVVEVLEDLGYVVMEAEDGGRALTLLQSDMRFDLLISDVGLPGGINGRQLADAARDLHPGLPVLFITGYAEAVSVEGGMLASDMHIMTKPFSLDVLASRVQAILVR